MTARVAGDLVGANRKTAAYYFYRLREITSHHLEPESKKFLSGNIEVDDSCFVGKRKKVREDVVQQAMFLCLAY